MKHIYFALFLFFFSCSSKQKETPQEALKEASKSSINLSGSVLNGLKIEEVNLVPDADQLVVVGSVNFDEDNIVRIFPIVSGSIENISVSLGDYVKKGQHLASIISTDINQYQVDVSISKSNFTIAEKNWARIAELYRTNFASEKELNEAQTAMDNARFEYEGKRKLLNLYGSRENKNDALFNVSAPNNGYIVERTINEGTQIRMDNNTHMFVISDLKTVWVWANVYESDISKIKVGDPVQVKTIAYPDKVYSGTIKKIGSMLDASARVVKVRIDLDNSDELLKPEMFATVTIMPKTSSKMLAVPKNAIFIENNKFWVIKQAGTNEFAKVEVQQGRSNSSYVEILSGLNAGEKIITDGALNVSTSINNQ